LGIGSCDIDSAKFGSGFESIVQNDLFKERWPAYCPYSL